MKPLFSVIIPVYNRPDEIRELLESLSAQSRHNFEVVITEDGSTIRCEDVVKEFIPHLDIKYYYKDNEGRSIARNHGMERAEGEWFIFFDSDCVIPPDYFEKLEEVVAKGGFDCYGGPDAAHDSFTDTQKAINFAMTSFLTTGGIRGGRKSMEKFTPRTFNMGFSREVYDSVGGFREMFSEDIDMSKRVECAGFRTALLADSPVWHKRRVDFRKFFRQVYVFGMSRITLKLLYPGSLKLVHTLPALFVVGLIALLLCGIIISPWFLLPIGIYISALFILSLATTHSLKVALLSLPASFVQLIGYGSGFIKAFFTKIILRRGRNVDEEILLRKGR